MKNCGNMTGIWDMMMSWQKDMEKGWKWWKRDENMMDTWWGSELDHQSHQLSVNPISPSTIVALNSWMNDDESGNYELFIMNFKIHNNIDESNIIMFDRVWPMISPVLLVRCQCWCFFWGTAIQVAEPTTKEIDWQARCSLGFYSNPATEISRHLLEK